jgi:hypothetical protein
MTQEKRNLRRTPYPDADGVTPGRDEERVTLVHTIVGTEPY